jgi:RNA polymerase sigma-B factor
MQKILMDGTSVNGRQLGSAARQLAELDDGELLRIVRSLPRTSRRRDRACELLVSRYRNLVLSCVQRYTRSPELTDDLIQVGYVGLLKAINNFDPTLGASLAAYAQPCITGEIKRHFRDKRWQVHVKRPLKELSLRIQDATEPLTQQLGHAPSDADLADTLSASEVMVRQARLARLALQPLSLDVPLSDSPGTASLADVLGQDDPNIEKLLDLHAIAAHWDELPHRERQILVMRFYDDMTQAQIGARLGISQMQVSRLLTRALRYLRECVLGLRESPAA